MTNRDLQARLMAGVQDLQRFRRELGDWAEDPMTARFMAMMGAAVEWHEQKMLQAINDDTHAKNHNLNYNRRQVYLDLLSVIDGLLEQKE